MNIVQEMMKEKNNSEKIDNFSFVKYFSVIINKN